MTEIEFIQRRCSLDKLTHNHSELVQCICGHSTQYGETTSDTTQTSTISICHRLLAHSSPELTQRSLGSGELCASKSLHFGMENLTVTGAVYKRAFDVVGWDASNPTQATAMNVVAAFSASWGAYQLSLGSSITSNRLFRPRRFCQIQLWTRLQICQLSMCIGTGIITQSTQEIRHESDVAYLKWSMPKTDADYKFFKRFRHCVHV